MCVCVCVCVTVCVCVCVCVTVCVCHCVCSHDLRAVQDSEIGFALLYISAKECCNPRVTPSEWNVCVGVSIYVQSCFNER